MGAITLLVMSLLFLSAVSIQHHGRFIQEEKSTCQWKCMTFALLWPGSFCLSLTEKLNCVIPQNIQKWTIHGLWPMNTGRCCSCWPIFPSDLEELEPELSLLWPTLVRRKNFTFWRDEWVKHGSCAACVEGMNSPTRYFQVVLKLRQRFDIDQALKDAGIKPSCNSSYKYDDIHKILVPVLGKTPEIQCVKDDSGREVWLQVKIPLLRDFTLGCPKHDQRQQAENPPDWHSSAGHPCPLQSPVFYFPINYDNPQHPCD